MKKLLTILFLCVGTFLITNTYASVATAPSTGAGTITVEENAKIGITDLKDMSIKEIEEKVGHKLNWKQKLGIKMLKSKSTKAAKAESNPDKPAGSGSTFIGLLLGLVLFLIGVLIAYLAFGDDRNVIKGAWIGAAAVLILYLLVL